MICKSYKTEMYPSRKQARFLFRWLNALRGVWNVNIREGTRAYIEANRDAVAEGSWEDDGGPSGPPVFYQERVKTKRVGLYQTYKLGPEWMKLIPSTFVGQSSRNMEKAWDRFFKGVGGRPTVHKKKGRVSGSAQRVKFVDESHIVIPVSGVMTKEEKGIMRKPIRLARPIGGWIAAGRPGRGKRGKSPARKPGWYGGEGGGGDVATISHEGGKWFVSFPTPEHHAPAPRDEQRASRGISREDCIGVDVNCGAFVCSDGVRYEIPDSLRKLESMIAESHRVLSRCEKGSRRYYAAKDVLNRRYARQARIRKDWLDKMTYDLVLRARAVAIEDIKTKNLTKSAKGTVHKPGRNVAAKSGLNRSILRASFYRFRQMLTYKCEWYGVELGIVNPAYTSQECSRCSAKQKMKLSKRVYRCKICGLEIDRDFNASINIREKFLRQKAQEVPGASGFKGDSAESDRADSWSGETTSSCGTPRRGSPSEGGDTHAGEARFAS